MPRSLRNTPSSSGRGSPVSTTQSGPPTSSGSKSKGKGKAVQPPVQKPKAPRIVWDGKHAARTSRLIAWCRENPIDRIKLFSDSLEDAKEDGRDKAQAKGSKSEFYLKIAKAVFDSDDEEQAVRDHFLKYPNDFVTPVASRFKTLKSKYNTFNSELKQTGAGLRAEDELRRDPKTNTLIDHLLQKFPWWPDLHGWWRQIPSFNANYSTADGGQDFSATALANFQGSSGARKSSANENAVDEAEDDDDEEVDELESDNGNDANGNAPAGPVATGLPVPIVGRSVSVSLERTNRGEISLNSPPRPAFQSTFRPANRAQPVEADDENMSLPGDFSDTNLDDNDFFSRIANDSGANDDAGADKSAGLAIADGDTAMDADESADSDSSTRRALQSLSMHSHKVSSMNNPPGASSSDTGSARSSSTAATSSGSRGAGRGSIKSAQNRNLKRVADTGGGLAAFQVGQSFADQLSNHTREKSNIKRARFDYKRDSKKLKLQADEDERAHALTMNRDKYAHEEKLAGMKLEQMRLEIELSITRRAEEEARVARLRAENPGDMGDQ